MNLPLPAGHYAIDTMHSQLGFAVTHLGISTIRGTFDSFRGALSVGGELADTRVTVEAETASINTGNRDRDVHVHAADWLDVANFPTMSFMSTSITAATQGTASARAYAVAGDLTIKGITQPVVLDVTFNGSQVFRLDGRMHHGFAAATVISRSAFEVSFGVPGVSDDVRLSLDAQFVSPPDDSA